MTFVHGKTTGVLVDEFDLSGFFNDTSATKTLDAAEVTTYGRDDKVYIPGVEDGQLTLGGFWDGAADAVDEVLAAAFGTHVVITAGWAGVGVLGDVVTMLEGIRTEYSIDSAVADAVGISAGAQAAHGIRCGGAVIHPLSEVDSASFDGDPYDGSAASLLGGVAHLHVTAFDGTDADIRLQHTADDPAGTPTWADLVAWEGVAAVGAIRSLVAGTVQRYLRVIVDGGTFTATTFAVAFVRNRR